MFHHQVVPIPFDVRDESSVAEAMAKSNVVVNLIGEPGRGRGRHRERAFTGSHKGVWGRGRGSPYYWV